MIRMEETGNGGDYVVSNDGILLDNSLDTIGYISWFGGNVKENTVQARKPKGRLYFDFWGNCDVFDLPNEQFNSNTERSLYKTPIKSGTLSVFESSAEQDLEFLKSDNYAETIDATARITNPDELYLDADVLQPSASEPETFSFFWKENFERSQ